MNRYAGLAAYNVWANERVFDAAAALPDAAYRADRGAFFKSIHGTLNHLLVTDQIWMKRFTGAGDAPDRLDAILCEALDDLREARLLEDARLSAFVARLDDAALAGKFRYTRASTGECYEQEFGPALDHLFNHQTHHRGQVHAMLTAAVGEAPSLDLLLFHREAGLGGTRRIP